MRPKIEIRKEEQEVVVLWAYREQYESHSKYKGRQPIAIWASVILFNLNPTWDGQLDSKEIRACISNSVGEFYRVHKKV